MTNTFCKKKKVPVYLALIVRNFLYHFLSGCVMVAVVGTSINAVNDQSSSNHANPHKPMMHAPSDQIGSKHCHKKC